jgi:probable rRNA maturation factor
MIRFFTEDTGYKLPQKTTCRRWLQAMAGQEGVLVGDLNYIFCSDDYLLTVNKQYLDHDDYTDIITFDNSETEGRIEGDIFISVDRVDDNWRIHQTTFADEMRRVLAHGLLHLCGYGDKTDADIVTMRAKEAEWLRAWEDGK